jgi:hypothetical protein
VRIADTAVPIPADRAPYLLLLLLLLLLQGITKA